MKLIVIGGQCRKVGKTTLVEQILRAFPAVEWLAVKLTPHPHSVSATQTQPAAGPAAFGKCGLEEDFLSTEDTDTGRFLRAGAHRAFLLRADPASIPAGFEVLERIASANAWTIAEGTSLLDFIRPALFLAVLDPQNTECKPAMRRHVRLADALVFRTPPPADLRMIPGLGSLESGRALPSAFLQPIASPLPEGLLRLLEGRIRA